MKPNKSKKQNITCVEATPRNIQLALERLEQKQTTFSKVFYGNSPTFHVKAECLDTNGVIDFTYCDKDGNNFESHGGGFERFEQLLRKELGINTNKGFVLSLSAYYDEIIYLRRCEKNPKFDRFLDIKGARVEAVEPKPLTMWEKFKRLFNTTLETESLKQSKIMYTPDDRINIIKGLILTNVQIMFNELDIFIQECSANYHTQVKLFDSLPDTTYLVD